MSTVGTFHAILIWLIQSYSDRSVSSGASLFYDLVCLVLRKPLRLSAPPDLKNRRLLQANSEVDKGKAGFRGALRATLYLAQYVVE